MIARISLALAIASTAVIATAPTALGECSAYDRPADTTLNVGYAFKARVVEASHDTDPNPRGDAQYDWHVELRVEDVYKGDMPRKLVFNGWGVGCHSIRGNRLDTGDLVIVAVEDLRLGRLPGEPTGGDTVVWRKDGDRWRYAKQIVGTPEYPPDAFLSPAIRGAATTAEILAVVRTAAPPDTSTSPSPGGSTSAAGQPPSPVLVIAGLLGLVAFGHRARRRRA